MACFCWQCVRFRRKKSKNYIGQCKECKAKIADNLDGCLNGIKKK